MRLYLVRHADPDYERNTLTALGHLEAQSLARRFAKIGLDHLYCSPLGRALDTARYTSESIERTVVVEPWLQELEWEIVHPEFGELSAWDLPGEVLRRAARDAAPRPSAIPHFRAEFQEEYEIRTAALDGLLAKHGFVRQGRLYRTSGENRERIALFSHGGLAIHLLAHLLDMPLHTAYACFWFPPSSVTTILFEERSSEWAAPRCIGMGDVSHLYADGLPVQPRGILGNTE